MHPSKPPTLVQLLVMLALALLSGCTLGPRLTPAPDAELVPGYHRAATSRQAGVRVTVVADAWRGRPENLHEAITPLRVTIENDGGRPLRIRYNEFSLNSETGIRYAALPPHEIEGTVSQVAPRAAYVPRFVHSGFLAAPYYDPPFIGLSPWSSPWVHDRFYYHRYYPVWKVRLPTRDMRETAIPERVLDPGGSISGFLYFPRLQSDSGRIVFVADLHRAGDGKEFGKLRIPFIVE